MTIIIKWFYYYFFLLQSEKTLTAKGPNVRLMLLQQQMFLVLKFKPIRQQIVEDLQQMAKDAEMLHLHNVVLLILHLKWKLDVHVCKEIKSFT